MWLLRILANSVQGWMENNENNKRLTLSCCAVMFLSFFFRRDVERNCFVMNSVKLLMIIVIFMAM